VVEMRERDTDHPRSRTVRGAVPCPCAALWSETRFLCHPNRTWRQRSWVADGLALLRLCILPALQTWLPPCDQGVPAQLDAAAVNPRAPQGRGVTFDKGSGGALTTLGRGDVPLSGEGVEPGQELRPHQEPGWCGDGPQGRKHRRLGEAGVQHRGFLIGVYTDPERQQCFP
jgi:hypothetical protein